MNAFSTSALCVIDLSVQERQTKSAPKLDFARIKEYRHTIDPEEADDSENDSDSDTNPSPSELLAPIEDPWDWDINLDSNLLLSVVTEANSQIGSAGSVENSAAPANSASQAPMDDGEWLELDF